LVYWPEFRQLEKSDVGESERNLIGHLHNSISFNGQTHREYVRLSVPFKRKKKTSPVFDMWWHNKYKSV